MPSLRPRTMADTNAPPLVNPQLSPAGNLLPCPSRVSSLSPVSPFFLSLGAKTLWVSGDFVSQEHGVPHDGPKDSNAGGCTREI
jgi:hypothetical protein